MFSRNALCPTQRCASMLLLLAPLCVGTIAAQQATPAPATPAPVTDDNVYVKLIFEGISQSAFEAYNNGTLYTVAAAAGVPPEYVWRVGAAASSSATASSVTSSNSSSTNSSNASMLMASGSSAPTEQQQQATSTTAGSSSAAPSGSTPKMLMASSNLPVADVPGVTDLVDTNLHYVEASSNSIVQPPTAKAATTMPTFGRKLLAEQAIAEYGIKTNRSMGDWATAEVIRRKVLSSAAGFGQASAAGFGRGFYATLEKNGVPYQPQVFLDNTQILAGALSTDAPKSRFGNRTSLEQPKLFSPQDLAGNFTPKATESKAVQPNPPQTLPSAAPATTSLHPAIIAAIAVGAFVFLALVSVFVWRCCVRSKENRIPSRGSTEQFLTHSPAHASAAGAV